jgi:hypothetical protein
MTPVEFAWNIRPDEELLLRSLLGCTFWSLFATRLVVSSGAVLAPALFIPLANGKGFISVASERLESPEEYIDGWRFSVSRADSIDGLDEASAILFENVSAVLLDAPLRIDTIAVYSTRELGDAEAVTFDHALILGSRGGRCVKLSHAQPSLHGLAVDAASEWPTDPPARSFYDE